MLTQEPFLVSGNEITEIPSENNPNIMNIYINKSESIKNKLRAKPRVLGEDIKHYDNIYKLLQEARKKSTVWNNEFYRRIHEAICNFTKSCGNNTEIIHPTQIGNYSNPQPIMNTLVQIINNKTISKTSPINIEAIQINSNNDIQNIINNKRIVSFIMGMTPNNTLTKEAYLHEKNNI